MPWPTKAVRAWGLWGWDPGSRDKAAGEGTLPLFSFVPGITRVDLPD